MSWELFGLHVAQSFMVPEKYTNQVSTLFLSSVPLPSTGPCFPGLLSLCIKELKEQALT